MSNTMEEMMSKPKFLFLCLVVTRCYVWPLNTLNLLHSLFSPLRPASRSLWPASSPVAHGNPRRRSSRAQQLASWAATPPQNWERCLCCPALRHWAACSALLLSDSLRCFACSEAAGALILWKGQKKRIEKRRINGKMFVYANRILFNWAVREPFFIGMHSTIPRVEMNKCINLFRVPHWFNLGGFKGRD